VVQGGIMPTDMAGASADQIPAAVLDMHPIRRIATLEEVAASVIYLAGPDGGTSPGQSSTRAAACSPDALRIQKTLALE
jgi:3-oxoacyl-[acyl-carrier protein] reductase